MIFRMI